MIKVLIVDDESLARVRMQRLLEKKSHVEIVGEAKDGLEAVEMAQQYLPDIVLMDVRMPEMDGLEAARQIATMNPPPAVIFCTAFEDFALRALTPKLSPTCSSRSRPLIWMRRCSEQAAPPVPSSAVELAVTGATSAAELTMALS